MRLVYESGAQSAVIRSLVLDGGVLVLVSEGLSLRVVSGHGLGSVVVLKAD